MSQSFCENKTRGPKLQHRLRRKRRPKSGGRKSLSFCLFASSLLPSWNHIFMPLASRLKSHLRLRHPPTQTIPRSQTRSPHGLPGARYACERVPLHVPQLTSFDQPSSKRFFHTARSQRPSSLSTSWSSALTHAIFTDLCTQTCRHGGHTEHMADWFLTSDECPVAGCDCLCQLRG